MLHFNFNKTNSSTQFCWNYIIKAEDSCLHYTHTKAEKNHTVGLNALGQDEHDIYGHVNMHTIPPHVHHEKSSNICIKSIVTWPSLSGARSTLIVTE